MYAGQQETLKFVQSNTDIGFTLPSTSVSTIIDPSGSDVTIVILYSCTLCILYSLSVCLLPFWCTCPKADRIEHKNKVKDFLQSNRELIGGLIITAILALVFEICTRNAHLIVWSVHKGNGLGNFRAVWLPQLLICFLATCVNVCGHLIIGGKKLAVQYLCNVIISNVHRSQGKTLSRCESFFNNTLRPFTSKVHVVLILHLTTFGVLYCFFPAIIMTFVYPTRMIAIFTFVAAYFFATTVVFAIMIKSYGLFWPEANKKRVKKFIFFILLLAMITLLMFIYATFLVFLYILIVGRGSVVSTGPLVIVSLFPSMIISFGAWTAKRMVLNGNQNIFSCQNVATIKRTETVEHLMLQEELDIV